MEPTVNKWPIRLLHEIKTCCTITQQPDHTLPIVALLKPNENDRGCRPIEHSDRNPQVRGHGNDSKTGTSPHAHKGSIQSVYKVLTQDMELPDTAIVVDALQLTIAPGRVVTATDGWTCPSVRPSHPIRLLSVH
jgi:hypothetical protein